MIKLVLRFMDGTVATVDCKDDLHALKTVKIIEKGMFDGGLTRLGDEDPPVYINPQMIICIDQTTEDELELFDKGNN